MKEIAVMTVTPPGRTPAPGPDRGRHQTRYPNRKLGTMFRTIRRWDVLIAVVLVAAAGVAAVDAGKLANFAISAAAVASVLAGTRIILEALLDRIANDSYDSGKAAERRAIVRDLAEYVEQKKRSAG